MYERYEDLKCGTRLIDVNVLHKRILALAIINEDAGDWAAYINIVPGINHSDEIKLACEDGAVKLSKKIAEEIFPNVSEEYTWRE